MYDIVEVLRDLIEAWDEERKCGFCWEFEAPLRESDLNESVQKTEECCVRVFVTNLRISKNRRYNLQASHYKASQVNSYSFDLNVLMRDDIGTNVYAEQAGHPISESKWERILKPLMLCIGDLDFCSQSAVLTYGSENWEAIIDRYDSYTGWRINMTINERIEI